MDSNVVPSNHEQPTRYRLYCDLDGVLVDFNSALKQVTGGKEWDDAVRDLGMDEVWRLIALGGSQWWADLEWTKDGQQLWKAIEPYNPTILTAGATSKIGDKAEVGKKDWCAKHLGQGVEVVVADQGSHKKYWSEPGSILIDDLEENIKHWRSRGGIGIHHKDALQTIRELNQHIQSLSQEDALEEDWRSLAAAGLVGLSTLAPQSALAAPKTPAAKPHAHAVVVKPSTVKKTVQAPLPAKSSKKQTPESVLMGYENSKDNPNGGWDKDAGKWYPHKSIEGGAKTIAYGHKIQPGEDFSKGLTDDQAMALLRQDIAKRETAIRKGIPSYDTLPQYVKNAIISAWYRGDLGTKATPKTVGLMNSGEWDKVSAEYLNHHDFRSGPEGVKKRMQNNANAFARYAEEIKTPAGTQLAYK